MLDVKGGYLGLTRPLNTTWADGRNVTVFPNGDVIERDTGYYIRRGASLNQFKEPQQVQVINNDAQFNSPGFNNSSMQNDISNMQQGFSRSNNQDLIILLVAVVAVVAIVNMSKK